MRILGWESRWSAKRWPDFRCGIPTPRHICRHLSAVHICPHRGDDRPLPGASGPACAPRSGTENRRGSACAPRSGGMEGLPALRPARRIAEGLPARRARRGESPTVRPRTFRRLWWRAGCARLPVCFVCLKKPPFSVSGVYGSACAGMCTAEIAFLRTPLLSHGSRSDRRCRVDFRILKKTVAFLRKAWYDKHVNLGNGRETAAVTTESAEAEAKGMGISVEDGRGARRRSPRCTGTKRGTSKGAGRRSEPLARVLHTTPAHPWAGRMRRRRRCRPASSCCRR